MAYISFQPTDFFSTTLYVGTGATDNAVTGVGFQPDATWIKDRDDSYSHRLWDAVNGATKYNTPDNSDAQGTNAQGLQSFDADGFTVGSMASVGENADNFATAVPAPLVYVITTFPLVGTASAVVAVDTSVILAYASTS